MNIYQEKRNLTFVTKRMFGSVGLGLSWLWKSTLLMALKFNPSAEMLALQRKQDANATRVPLIFIVRSNATLRCNYLF